MIASTMALPRCRTAFPLLLLLLVMLSWPGGALADALGGPAHHGSSTPATQVEADHETSPADLPATAPEDRDDQPGMAAAALLAVAIAGAVAGRRSRRVVVVGLILLVATFTFETGLHSVHHGFDPTRAETCVVAAAANQVSGVAADGPTVADVPLPLHPGALDVASTTPLQRFLCPDQGRAPPASTV
jgi:hypothetical protein